MVAAVEDHYGRIDLLVSNAGFASQELDLDDALAQPDATWQQMWDVHVMAHVSRLPRGVAGDAGARQRDNSSTSRRPRVS